MTRHQFLRRLASNGSSTGTAGAPTCSCTGAKHLQPFSGRAKTSSQGTRRSRLVRVARSLLPRRCYTAVVVRCEDTVCWPRQRALLNQEKRQGLGMLERRRATCRSFESTTKYESGTALAQLLRTPIEPASSVPSRARLAGAVIWPRTEYHCHSVTAGTRGTSALQRWTEADG